MKKLKKKRALVLALSIVALISIPAGVYAILNATSNEETNQFTGAFVNAAVMENNKEHENSENNIETYKSLKNNADYVEKIVSIKNIATGDMATSMYTRVKLIPTIVSDNEQEPSILGGEVKITYEFKTNTAWMVKDNTYYYTKPIDPGQESEILLTGVTINQDIPDGYHVELKVLSDSIVTRPESILTDTWEVKTDFSDCSAI